jgi:integrase
MERFQRKSTADIGDFYWQISWRIIEMKMLWPCAGKEIERMAVFQKYKGGSYYIDFRYQDRNGKTQKFRRSAGKSTTKRQALRLEQQWKREIELSEAIAAENGESAKGGKRKSATFSGFTKHWYDLHVVPNNRASEAVKKETIIRVHLVPFFGDRKLREITPEHVSKFIAEKARDGLAPKTIVNLLGCLRTMLNFAVKWGYLEQNPVNQVEPPKVPQQDFDFYDPEEATQFLKAVEEHEPKWLPFFLTAFRTGMRLGELFGLRWKHVDFERGVIRVQASFDGKVEGPPKNGRGRDIPMSPALKKALEPLKGKRSDLVFPDRKGGYLNRNKVKWPFWRFTEKAKLRTIRMHDMRHSFASQLVIKNVHLKVVQDLLGHSDIRMTMRYAHLAPQMNQDAVMLLDGDVE